MVAPRQRVLKSGALGIEAHELLRALPDTPAAEHPALVPVLWLPPRSVLLVLLLCWVVFCCGAWWLIQAVGSPSAEHVSDCLLVGIEPGGWS
jgi:hypothetical protein